ncbi:hypothetical protein ACI65C_005898 [Semiaphis heraclei]
MEDLNRSYSSNIEFFGYWIIPVSNWQCRFIDLSQSSVSRCISEVVEAINQPEIFNEWVKFPSTLNELTEADNGFYRETGFPGVIGCVDCTHVAIVPPSSDSGYPLRKWLLTPISNPTTDAEKYYNQKQMSTRSIIECCNGVLKMRFRCLLKDRTLHYKPEKASLIINACIVLHNMCITNNVPLYEHDISVHDDLGMMGNQEILVDNIRNLDLAIGRQHRNKIITYLFQRHFV